MKSAPFLACYKLHEICQLFLAGFLLADLEAQAQEKADGLP
jgi:hypothetical protein